MHSRLTGTFDQSSLATYSQMMETIYFVQKFFVKLLCSIAIFQTQHSIDVLIDRVRFQNYTDVHCEPIYNLRQTYCWCRYCCPC